MSIVAQATDESAGCTHLRANATSCWICYWTSTGFHSQMAGNHQGVFSLTVLLEPPELDAEAPSACAETCQDRATSCCYLSCSLVGIWSFLAPVFWKHGLLPPWREPGEEWTPDWLNAEAGQKKRNKDKREVDCSEHWHKLCWSNPISHPHSCGSLQLTLSSISTFTVSIPFPVSIVWSQVAFANVLNCASDRTVFTARCGYHGAQKTAFREKCISSTNRSKNWK